MSKAKKIVITLMAFVVLSGGVVAGILLVNQNQDIREKAAPSTSLSFVPSSMTKNPGQSITLAINANTGENLITGVDVEVSFDPNVIHLTQMSPNPSISDLSTIIKNGVIDNTLGKARFAAFTVDKTKAVSGNLSLVTLTGNIVSGASSGSTTLQFTSSTSLSAVDEGQNVIINSQPATITVSSGNISSTSSPTPTSSPSPTATAGIGGAQITLPSATPSPTPLKTATPTTNSNLNNNNTTTNNNTSSGGATSVPADVPVTGASIPFLISIFVGVVAIGLSLFLAF